MPFKLKITICIISEKYLLHYYLLLFITIYFYFSNYKSSLLLASSKSRVLSDLTFSSSLIFTPPISLTFLPFEIN